MTRSSISGLWWRIFLSVLGLRIWARWSRGMLCLWMMCAQKQMCVSLSVSRLRARNPRKHKPHGSRFVCSLTRLNHWRETREWYIYECDTIIIRTSPDSNEYSSSWVEYEKFYDELSSVVLMFLIFYSESNLIFPTSLTLNIDKIPRNLSGPPLRAEIHAYLATNLNKRETV